MQKWRTLSRVILMLLVTVHLFTWYAVGIHIVGSIGIEALFAGLSRGVINAGFVFWMLVFASTLLLGRAFCGWFCWFGAYQELVAWGIGDRFKIKMPRHVLLYLGIIPFVSLGLKVYYTWIVNWLEGMPGAFSFNFANVEPWGGQQTGISILITLVLYGPVLMYVFGRRAWCRHLCPIGALLRAFGKFRPAKVRLVKGDCIGCGTCNRVCDMEIDVLGELEAHGEVCSTNCNVCLKCIDECPQKALGYTFRRTCMSMSPEAGARAERQTAKRRRLSAFDAIIALLWISVVLTFSVAGLRQNSPQEMKVLMTPGLLLIFYGLALIAKKAWGKVGGVKAIGDKLILAILLTLALTACGGGDADTPDESTPAGVTPTDDYADALPVSAQLAIGTLMLEGSQEAVTAEQAQDLLSLWQMLQALQSSGTAAQAELDAVLNQIQQAMTSEQLAAIKEMKLTADSLTDWIQESTRGAGGGLGRLGGFQPPAGVMPGGGGQGGGMRPGGGFGTGGDVDPEAVQAALAERIRTQAGTMMTRSLISLLQARAAGEEWERAAPDRGFALQRTLLSVVAEATEMEQRVIMAQIGEGQSLTDILEANGADLGDVVAQVVAAETERVEQAVAEGTLDQAEADELLADLEARVRELLEQPFQLGARGPFGEAGDQP